MTPPPESRIPSPSIQARLLSIYTNALDLLAERTPLQEDWHRLRGIATNAEAALADLRDLRDAGTIPEDL